MKPNKYDDDMMMVKDCPVSETFTLKRHQHIHELFLLCHKIHQGLCEIVNYLRHLS